MLLPTATGWRYAVNAGESGTACWHHPAAPSYDTSCSFHVNVQARSVGQSTMGSKRAMLVVTQRNRPGTLQPVRRKGTCVVASQHHEAVAMCFCALVCGRWFGTVANKSC